MFSQRQLLHYLSSEAAASEPVKNHETVITPAGWVGCTGGLEKKRGSRLRSTQMSRDRIQDIQEVVERDSEMIMEAVRKVRY